MRTRREEKYALPIVIVGVGGAGGDFRLDLGKLDLIGCKEGKQTYKQVRPGTRNERGMLNPYIYIRAHRIKRMIDESTPRCLRHSTLVIQTTTTVSLHRYPSRVRRLFIQTLTFPPVASR